MFSYFSHPPGKLVHFFFPVAVTVLQLLTPQWFYFHHFAEVCTELVPNSVSLQHCASFHSPSSQTGQALPMPASHPHKPSRKREVEAAGGAAFLPALLAGGKELFVHVPRGRSWEHLSDCLLDLKKKIQNLGLFISVPVT